MVVAMNPIAASTPRASTTCIAGRRSGGGHGPLGFGSGSLMGPHS